MTKLNKYKSSVSYMNESKQAGLPSTLGSHGPIPNFCSPKLVYMYWGGKTGDGSMSGRYNEKYKVLDAKELMVYFKN